MKWVLVLLALLPLAAQKRDFSKVDDEQAISFYRNALQGRSDPGLFLEPKIEQQTCGLIVNYIQLDHVESYSAKRTQTLGKLGISPASANTLKIGVASRLIKDLAVRLVQNKPLKEFCMYCICGGGMCGTAILRLSKLYEVGNYLDEVLKDNPTIGTEVPRAEIREHWKKSVITEAPALMNQCAREMRDSEELWRKYGQACKTLVKALAEPIEPSVLGLSSEMTAKLQSNK